MSPSAVDFGAVFVGAPNSVNVTITNTGGEDLQLTGISIAPPENDFDIPLLSGGLPPAFPVFIAPGNSVTFNLTYTPSEIGVDENKVKISTNDPLNPVVEVPIDGEGIAPVSPEIDVSRTSISFAAAVVGSARSRLLKITNEGTGDLALSSLALVSTSRGVYFLRNVPSDFPYLLLPNNSLVVTIDFSPLYAVPYFADLVITSDDEDEGIVNVALSGMGVPVELPEIAVFPEAVDFGEVFIGSPSSMKLTISNTGFARLEILSIQLTPTTSGEFAISGFAQPISLPFGASVETEITYTPGEAGAVLGILEIESDDEDEPVVTVSLSGTGVREPVPQIQVVPASIDFMETFVGTSSPMSVEITNTGTASLEITRIDRGPGTSTDFEVTGFAQSISLAPGANVMTEVTYTPSEVGLDDGTLVIDSNDAERPQFAVSLLGTGVPATTPQIQVTAPPVLDYGTVFTGASGALSVGIANIGTAPLEITGIELGPDSSLDFEITGFSDTISLVPGASVTTEVTYVPLDDGADSGTLVIHSNDADQPVVTVSLAGTGVPVPVARIQVTPESLEFADVFVDTPNSMTVEITNIGTALLDVSSIRLSAETSDEFAVTGFDQKIILVPDASVVTEITYTPNDEGADSGTLMIESDDAEMGTSIVSLTGVGVPEPRPRIEVMPADLDYDQVQIGAASTQTVTIGNSGIETLEISFIGLGAYTLGEFLITDGPEIASVLPGEEITVDVTYSPSGEGADSGTLRIDSNDSEDSTVSVSLTGAGVPAPVPQIAVHPTSLTFGEVFIGSSSPLALTISNTGSAPLEVDIALGVASSTDFAITGGATSANLGPGMEAIVEVTYTPTDAASDSGTLRIQSNDAEEPQVTVSLFGTGVINDTVEPRFTRGDANADGAIDVADPIKTIGSLFRDESIPACFDAADSNDDGRLNLSDGIFTLIWLFGEGPPAPPPGFYNCGPDPTEDELPPCDFPIDLCVE